MPHFGANLGVFDNEGDRFWSRSVADDLDVGAVPEGRSIYFTPIRDAYFGEAGATIESIPPNLRHRWR